MEAALQTNIQTCYHCGDTCEKDKIVAHEKAFCCTGCKNVFELFEENNLYTYYNLEQSPGITGNQPVAESRFAYLDDAGIEAQLINFLTLAATSGREPRIEVVKEISQGQLKQLWNESVLS
ncbi:heavy metal translocating P-type ATPase metal-binding domain-containing protein [Pontibacter harenae]|uniref:heavy metal translocating P-type ATPase metal-binding domain-containing protein n=1 Tax=Pontibacter harenae TaxID=2894083 RepID=UPI001E2C727E|nr:heavy metal translocating P-type ATPase metal-binding domain-containing protein [Pontibacter harenae]MCC9168256.1 heavy metal translocating P-type ATPase metal-binding domain-containing protein [Pontibacter harenae]